MDARGNRDSAAERRLLYPHHYHARTQRAGLRELAPLTLDAQALRPHQGRADSENEQDSATSEDDDTKRRRFWNRCYF